MARNPLPPGAHTRRTLSGHPKRDALRPSEFLHNIHTDEEVVHKAIVNLLSAGIEVFGEEEARSFAPELVRILTLDGVPSGY